MKSPQHEIKFFQKYYAFIRKMSQNITLGKANQWWVSLISIYVYLPVSIDMITMITNDKHDKYVHTPFSINMITINTIMYLRYV